MGFIWIVVVGAAAGWLVGRWITPNEYGAPGDIIIGVMGAFVAALLFKMFGPAGGVGIVWAVIITAAGSVVLLFGSRRFMKPKVIPVPRPR